MSDFKAKMHQIRFPLGIRPADSAGGVLQRSRRALQLYLMGLLLRGGRGSEKEGKKRERGEKGEKSR